jgi:hypothetical protein
MRNKCSRRQAAYMNIIDRSKSFSQERVATLSKFTIMALLVRLELDIHSIDPRRTDFNQASAIGVGESDKDALNAMNLQ